MPPKLPEKPGLPELREQTVYIPYTKLREVFEQEGRGVFLPYDKFRALWEAAQDKSGTGTEVPPPFQTMLHEATHRAVVERDVVRVTAVLQFEVLGRGWHRLPLRLKDAALLSAKIGDQPARVVHDPSEGYFLLIERTQADVLRGELTLEYAKAFEKSPGRNRVSFQTPQAPVSRWQVRVDEPGVKIDLEPLIAASELPRGAEAPTKSEVQAFVGAAEEVRIEWTPRAEGAQGLEAVAHVQVAQEVEVDETVVRNRIRLQYVISRAELPRLSFELPAGQRLVNVFDSNVKQWSVQPKENGEQTVTVELFEPAKQSQALTIELEQLTPEAAQREIVVPTVIVQGVGRQQGTLVVRGAEGLQLDAVKRVGLSQLDQAELPAGIKRDGWTFMYRYAASRFELTLSAKRVMPQLTIDALVEGVLEPEQWLVDVNALVDIRRAGVFTLEWLVPAGYEVRQVRGTTWPTAAPQPTAALVKIESHRIVEGPPRRLVIQLASKAEGLVGLNLVLVRKLDHAELRTPLGRAAALDVSLPVPAPEGLERFQGRFILYAPENLRLHPRERTGLQEMPLAEAAAGQPPTSGSRRDVRVVQSYAFSDESARLQMDAERRQPHVTVRQSLMARIEPGLIKFQAALHYEIRFNGVRSLRLDLPQGVATKARVDLPGVRETVVMPPPADLAKGDVAWNLTGEREFLGEVMIPISWEEPLTGFDVGRSVELVVPQIKPRGVDRAWGQIVVHKAEAIEVSEQGEPLGVRPIDPQQDLIDGPAPGVARAFEFHDDYRLTLGATRYELEEIKRSSIERSVVRWVVTRGGTVSTQALFRLRSMRQRLAVQLPAEAQLEADPLRVQGRSIALEKGATAGEYFVPLPSAASEESVLIELRYTLAGPLDRFALPKFPEEPAVQKVYACVYLPERLALSGVGGGWNEEMDWRLNEHAGRVRRRWGYEPIPWRSDTNLLQWVAEGTTQDRNSLERFATDGRMYLFSILRPAGDTPLELQATEQWRVQLGIVVLVLVAGLALLKTPARVRILTLGIGLATIVGLGVFRPLLAYEIVNEALTGALVVVVIFWGLARWFRPERRPPLDDKPGAEPPTPPSSPPQPDLRTSMLVMEPTFSPEPTPPAESSEKGGDHDA